MRLLLIIFVVFVMVVTADADDRFNFTYTKPEPWLNLKPSDIYPSPEARDCAELWRSAFQKLNGMTDEYFEAHVSIVATHIDEGRPDGHTFRDCFVSAYFHVDWVRIHIWNSFTISTESICDSVAADDLVRRNQADTAHSDCVFRVNITRIKPLEHIASKEQIVWAVERANPFLGLNVNGYTNVTRDGDIEYKLYGVVDAEAGVCVKARVRLEDATVYDVSRTSCRKK